MDLESSFELIELAQAGDASALDRLLVRYRPRLQRWASGRLPRYAREMADTEDLVQEALLGTFRNIQRFNNRGEWALQAYLRRAVMNRLRNELERFHSRPRTEEVSEALVSRELLPLEQAVGAEVFARYEGALDELEKILEREAVIARVELGCSYQEIAFLLEKPSADAARMTTVSRGATRLAVTHVAAPNLTLASSSPLDIILSHSPRAMQSGHSSISSAEAVADGAQIDWDHAESSADDPAELHIVQQLRHLATVGLAARKQALTFGGPAPSPR